MTELEETVLLANKVLDRPNCDPDDDLCMLARQFLRQREIVACLKKDLAAKYDGIAAQYEDGRELVESNRDELLRVTQEGLSRVHAALSQNNVNLALKVIRAVNTFHPMNCDSWSGWPE